MKIVSRPEPWKPTTPTDYLFTALGLAGMPQEEMSRVIGIHIDQHGVVTATLIDPRGVSLNLGTGTVSHMTYTKEYHL